MIGASVTPLCIAASKHTVRLLRYRMALIRETHVGYREMGRIVVPLIFGPDTSRHCEMAQVHISAVSDGL